MLKKEDLDAPARLHYANAGATPDAGGRGWDDAEEYPSLREAIHRSMNVEPPAGMEPVIRTASGAVIGPDRLEEIWLSIQGP